MWRTLKRLILILSLSIATAAFVLFLFAYSYDTRLKRHFDGIANGMSEQQVLSVIGKPDSIGKCGEFGRGVVPHGCNREYLFKPLLDVGTWAVFFDSKGQVVGKYKYESP